MSRVLLVDDAMDLGVLIKAVLGAVDVHQASNLTEAVAAVRDKRPAVVLLDLALGEEDGMDLLDRVATEAEFSGLPIVVFSVHDSRFPEALDKGAVDCLRKPFKTKDLVRVVEPYLAEGLPAIT